MPANGSPWGLLPIACVLFVIVVTRVGALVFDRDLLRRQVLGGALLSFALAVVVVRLFGAVGLLGRWPLFAALAVTAGALSFVRRERKLAVPYRELFSRENLPLVLAGTGSVVTALVAAYFLPIWQWDSLGYHLPYVSFALQAGSLAGVPHDMFYISTYPHVVELFFVAWRGLLPDDRLVDMAQIPFALLGSVAVAVVARDHGARRDHAFAAGLAWLTLPALFLQLPTDYVDIGSASLLLVAGSFVLAPKSSRNVLACGVAIGLFLGSKPNAPMGTVLLFATLAVPAWKEGRRGTLGIAAVIVLLLGAEAYVVNIVRHANPIWPVEVKLGPIHLPGLRPMSYLLESGASAPQLYGAGPVRILRSWTALAAPPMFDMRYGGLGILFLAALPFALWEAVRRRSVALGLVFATTLASPDPAIARYIFAFPAIAFALTAAALRNLGSRARTTVLWVAGIAAMLSLSHAYAGLAGEGPPLGEYPSMSPEDRARAVGADGPPTKYLDAHARISKGEKLVFDDTLDLPYLAFAGDLSHRAVWVAPDADPAIVDALVDDPTVRVLVAGDLTRMAWLAQSRFEALFHCKSSSCTVYVRR